jgi:hypothetical protein
MHAEHLQKQRMLEGSPGRSLLAKPCVLRSFCVEELKEDFSTL